MTKEFLSLVHGLGASVHIDREGVAKDSSHHGGPGGETKNASATCLSPFIASWAQPMGWLHTHLSFHMPGCSLPTS